MPEREFTAGTGYKFGYQGQEEDNELKGNGNSLNYKYRVHDTRLRRFFSVDPLAKKFAYNSTYAFSENRVIDGVELEGREVVLIGRNVSGSALITVGTEAGIAFGPDGVYAYASGALGIETDAGVATRLSITFFPDMESVMDASGKGYSVNVSGDAPAGFSASIGVAFSGDNVGLNVQVGIGASILPVAVSATRSNTGMKALSPGAITAEQFKLLSEGRDALTQERDALNKQSLDLTKDYDKLYNEANNIAQKASSSKDLATQEKLNSQYAGKVNEMNNILGKVQENEKNVSNINTAIEKIDELMPKK